MADSVIRCKGCGIVFENADPNIDKCAGKKLYCELCLAQKNPRSEIEQRLKKKYILVTAIAAFVVLLTITAIHWGKSRNDNIFEYILGFGFSYLIIWGFAAILLLPVFMVMKKPHKIQIRQEKEKFIEELEEKKASRKAQQKQ